MLLNCPGSVPNPFPRVSSYCMGGGWCSRASRDVRHTAMQPYRQRQMDACMCRGAQSVHCLHSTARGVGEGRCPYLVASRKEPPPQGMWNQAADIWRRSCNWQVGWSGRNRLDTQLHPAARGQLAGSWTVHRHGLNVLSTSAGVALQQDSKPQARVVAGTHRDKARGRPGRATAAAPVWAAAPCCWGGALCLQSMPVQQSRRAEPGAEACNKDASEGCAGTACPDV